jgi:hypothetical protein
MLGVRSQNDLCYVVLKHNSKPYINVVVDLDEDRSLGPYGAPIKELIYLHFNSNIFISIVL